MKHLRFLSRILEVTALSLASIHVILFLYVWIKNSAYPIGFGVIQWHILENVQRIFAGLPLYAEPSLEFIPDIYTPLYYYLTALFSLAFGVKLLAGKIVSLIAMLGVSACLFIWLKNELKSLSLAFLGAAIFLATYNLYDFRNYMVRVDALFCFLTMLGCYFLYCKKSALSAIWAALVFLLAFMTKQSALIIILPVCYAFLVIDRSKRSQYFALFFGLILILTITLYNYKTDGWFWYFIFELPSQHAFAPREWLGFWVYMLTHTWPLMILSLVALWQIYRAENLRKALLYACLLSAFFLCSYSMRLHSGGMRNTFMPACAAIALFAPLAFKHVHSKYARAVMMLLICIQFIMLQYDPRVSAPSDYNIARGQKYLDYLGGLEGDILVEGGGYYSTRKGKKTYNINTSFWDIVRTGNDELKEKLHTEFADAIKQQKFSAIITYFPDPDKRYIKFKTHYNIAKYYDFKEKINSRLTSAELASIGALDQKHFFRNYTQPIFVFVPKEMANE